MIARPVARNRPVIRKTVRLRLALLYSGLFLTSGTVLLAIAYLLLAANFPQLVKVSTGSEAGTALPSLSIGTQVQQLGAQQRTDALNQLLIYSAIALAIMSVLSLGLGWLFAGRILRPLRTITSSVRQLSETSLNERLAMTGPDDELKELSDTFDGLLTRLEQSFEAQRQFVANASHELRTPLTRQRTLLEVALAAPDPTVEDLRTASERALAAGVEQERLIEALLTLARSQRGLDRREPMDLSSITSEVVQARKAEAQHSGVTISHDLSPAPAYGDPRLAERLAANLIDNALRHNIPDGQVQVETGTRHGQPFLTITNTGPMISPTQIAGLFEPFARQGTERTGDGLGLGLSIVNAIARAHDAPVSAWTLPEGGLKIQVSFLLGVMVSCPGGPWPDP
jgi:signal transduction histidine kinase